MFNKKHDNHHFAQPKPNERSEEILLFQVFGKEEKNTLENRKIKLAVMCS